MSLLQHDLLTVDDIKSLIQGLVLIFLLAFAIVKV